MTSATPAIGTTTPLARFLDIVRLRYVLMWAQIRRSAGRMLWFVFIQIVFIVAAVIGAVLGFGALVVAVQAGQAEPIAQAIVGVIFLNTIVASLVFGYGLNQAFSDKSLRRYPFSHAERFVIRHVLGLFEPLWLISIAAYLGAAIGAGALGAAPFWITIPAAVLLLCSNYLLVRFMLAFADLLMQTTVGSVVLVTLTQLFFFIPMASRGFFSTPARRAAGAALMAYTPPAAAGSLIAGGPVLRHMLVLLAWLAVAVTLLFWLDRRPDRSHVSGSGAASWNGPIDRLTAILPQRWAPLVARGLRFYLRNYQVQLSFVGLMIFVGVMPLYMTRRSTSPTALFELTMLMVPFLGTVTSALAPNAFGFEGAGARRLLLAPVDRRVVLGSMNLASAIICGTYLLLAIAIWSAFVAPAPRMVLMLITHGMTGLLLFHAVALWTSVLMPVRADYYEKFRRQQSGGTRITILLLMGMMAVSAGVRQILLPGPLVDYWWISALVMTACAGAYAASFGPAAALFGRRRERMLAVVEGRA